MFFIDILEIRSFLWNDTERYCTDVTRLRFANMDCTAHTVPITQCVNVHT